MELSYNGTHYHGWQVQDNASSVQGKLNHCLSLLLRENIEITGSGRTDMGVHALHQVAHFDTGQTGLNSDDLAYKLNAFLPNDIAIKKIRPVHDDAHARFSAIRRGYEYRIIQHKSPFMNGLALYFKPALDWQRMNEASFYLLGQQNFRSFSKTQTDVQHFDCELVEAYWEWRNDYLAFSVKANRFLRSMVRTVVGTLLDVGTGKLAPEAVKEIINQGDRKAAGKAVPAHGLFLKEVSYPPGIYI